MRTIERKLTIPFVLWTLLALGLGFLLRYHNLDVRPFHHDESLHATYGLYYYTDAKNLFYHYDPMLHGPLLYNLLPWSYHFFGVSKWSARLLTMLFSLVPLIAPLFFRQKLGNRRTVEIILLLALSPSLIYWGRFLRHDLLMLAFTCTLVISTVLIHDWSRQLLFWCSLGLAFCVKENSYVHALLILIFLIYEYIISTKRSVEPYLSRIFPWFSSAPIPLFFGIVLAIASCAYFYSAGFVYPEGILDGLYRKSLSYWVQQHHQERISGPFSYSFLFLSWYEIPLLFLMVIYYIHNFFSSTLKTKFTYLLVILLGVLTHWGMEHHFSREFLSTWLKLKIPLDAYLFWIFLISGIGFTTKHLLDRRQDLALLSYSFFSLLFTYSYLGEKVPWLTMYFIVVGYIYFWIYIRQLIGRWPSSIAMVIFLSVNILLAIQINFLDSHQAQELISQVHTSKSYEDLSNSLAQELEQTHSSILALDSNTWPLTWFLYGKEGYVFNPDVSDASNYQHVLVDLPDLEWEQKLSSTHAREIIPLRYWWWPDFEKMNFKNYFWYLFTHEGWNPNGQKFISHYYLRPTIEQ